MGDVPIQFIYNGIILIVVFPFLSNRRFWKITST